jgi:hypothetical protein
MSAPGAARPAEPRVGEREDAEEECGPGGEKPSVLERLRDLFYISYYGFSLKWGSIHSGKSVQESGR